MFVTELLSGFQKQDRGICVEICAFDDARVPFALRSASRDSEHLGPHASHGLQAEEAEVRQRRNLSFTVSVVPSMRE